MFINEEIIPCCGYECLSNRKDILSLTLKGRRDRSGELEARINSGANASAVVRAATLIGP